MRRFVGLAFSLLFASTSIHAQAVFAVLGGGAQGASDAGSVARVDVLTGNLTILSTPAPGSGLTGIAALPDGRVFVSSANNNGAGTNAQLIQINPLTGATVAVIGDLTLGGNPEPVHDLAADPTTGLLYGVLAGNRSLVTINPATAAMTSIGIPDYQGQDNGFAAIAFTPDGRLWSQEANGPDRWELNPATAAVIAGPVANTPSPDPGFTVGSIALGALNNSTLLLAECCNGTLGNTLYTLDLVSGTASFVGGMGGAMGTERRVHDFAVVAIPATQVPTQSFGGLMLLGLLLAGVGGAVMLRMRAG